MRILLILLLCGNLFPLWSQSPNLGLPTIRNFLKETYAGGTQNWDFAQDERGRIYVANNEGLLVFDGVNWQTYPLPNQTIVRSVAILPDGRILVGGQNELGYFGGDDLGQLQYHSLVEQLPDSLQNFADVWDIELLGGQAYLRTSHLLLAFEGNTLQVLAHAPDINYLYLGIIGEEIYLQTEVQGLCQWHAGRLIPLLSGPAWSERLVIALLPWEGGQMLLATLRDGLWLLHQGEARRWAISHDSLLKTWRVHDACLITGQRVALGTSMGGLLIIDTAGTVIQHLNQPQGLQDNNVLTLFTDHSQNLWLGLNYGVDFLEFNSPLTRIYPDADLRGTAYTACFFQDHLYLGTSNGLYQVPWQAYYDPTLGSPWLLVPGTQGQVWNLSVIDGQLLMGHHEGAFVVEGQTARHVPGTSGIWNFISLPSHPGQVIAGSYQGLVHLANESQGLTLVGSIPGLEESSRFLVAGGPGTIWVSHPYRGIFRVVLDQALSRGQVTRFGQAQGLPSDNYNHVFALNGEVVFTGEKGIFTTSPGQDQMLPYEDFQSVFQPDQRIIRLQEDDRGNVWYATEEEVGVLWIDDKGLRKDIKRQPIPPLAGRLVGGFELIYPMDAEHVFFGLEKGFIRYTPQAAAQPTQPWQVVVSQVMATGPSAQVLFGGHSTRPKVWSFPNQQNALRITCGATRYVEPDGIQFRYRLRGLDRDWGAWTDLPVKEYTNLANGDYHFEVQSRDGMGSLSKVAGFDFTIQPAWYQSSTAMIAYAMVGLAFLLSLVLVPRRQFEKEKAELQQVHHIQQAASREQIALTKAQVEALEREKLEADNRHKSQELATATMHLVQKNEVIAHVRTELEGLITRHRDHPSSKDIQSMVRMLGHDQQFDQDWEQFAAHFDQVHAGFLRRLSECYGQLTPKDQRLCAYLRMNLSTKEIAPLMNISVRGVEISRYRLRKKLDLDRDINLNEFMMNF
jgi:DNA-binding CsgD family transcriptional regulator